MYLLRFSFLLELGLPPCPQWPSMSSLHEISDLVTKPPWQRILMLGEVPSQTLNMNFPAQVPIVFQDWQTYFSLKIKLIFISLLSNELNFRCQFKRRRIRETSWFLTNFVFFNISIHTCLIHTYSNTSAHHLAPSQHSKLCSESPKICNYL